MLAPLTRKGANHSLHVGKKMLPTTTEQALTEMRAAAGLRLLWTHNLYNNNHLMMHRFLREGSTGGVFAALGVFGRVAVRDEIQQKKTDVELFRRMKRVMMI